MHNQKRSQRFGWILAIARAAAALPGRVVGDRRATLILAVSVSVSSAAAGEPCKPHWSTYIGQPGVDSAVMTMTTFDAGMGEALYIGGDFVQVGGQSINRIARWNGWQWSPLGSGMSGVSPWVSALVDLDDGSGPALYAGGGFSHAGGVSANRIARWSPATQTWSALGEGMNNEVLALTVFDDGGGPALYAGGKFTMAGGVAASRIAKWDGQQWSPLGEGVGGTVGWVQDLLVFDDGSGPALYVGGYFTSAGGKPANRIARWDGANWTTLGDGLGGPVRGMAIFDDGSGPALHVGGMFTIAGGQPANRVAKWDGKNWSPLGSGVNANVLSVHVLDAGLGPALFVSGTFSTAGGQPAQRIARWDGQGWSALGSGLNLAASAMTDFNDGSYGNLRSLIMGGLFTQAGDVPVGGIATWREPFNGGPGDFNCDGQVDGTDLLILLRSWGKCSDPANCPADFNGDGVVDGGDLLILLSNWG